MSPRELFRELGVALSQLLPFARSGATGQPHGIEALAFGRAVMAATQRIDGLPWQALLEASTTHLSHQEREALMDGAPATPFAVCMTSDHSWLLRLAEPDGVPAESASLARLASYCRDRGFTYLRLDDDAPCLPGLLVHPE